MYDKYSKRSRRFGFVTMSTVEDATAATENLNDTVSNPNPTLFFYPFRSDRL